MKPLPFITLAILIHLSTKFFWDFNYDYSLYTQLKEARESMDIVWVNDVLDKIQIQETDGANRFSLGITLVMFIWVCLTRVNFELTPKLKILLNGWLIWVANDFLKEVAFRFDILHWLFANPTVKDLNEYAAFGISAFIVGWQLRRLRRSK